MSLEDDLMKRFGSERIKDFLDRMNISEADSVIESKMISKQVESAQKRVEGNNYDARKNTLQYDDVMREQREVIYKERMQIINSTEDLMKPVILPMIQRTVHRIVNLYTQGDSKDWNLQAILNFAWSNMVGEDKLQLDNLKGLTADGIYNLLMSFVDENYKQKQRQLADPHKCLNLKK